MCMKIFECLFLYLTQVLHVGSTSKQESARGIKCECRRGGCTRKCSAFSEMFPKFVCGKFPWWPEHYLVATAAVLCVFFFFLFNLF